MKKKIANEPIVLSGRVYLDGFLVEQVNRFHLPAELRRGDIRLHNVNRPGQRPRFGGTVSFGGFIAASIWDGKSWRRLLLRKKAAVEATHTGVVQMRSRAVECVGTLTRLVGWTAVWFTNDKGYEVAYDAYPGKFVASSVAAASTGTSAKPNGPAAAEKTAAEKTAAENVSPTVATGASAVSSADKPVSAVSDVKPQQLSLFEDAELPASSPVRRPRRRSKK